MPHQYPKAHINQHLHEQKIKITPHSTHPAVLVCVFCRAHVQLHQVHQISHQTHTL